MNRILTFIFCVCFFFTYAQDPDDFTLDGFVVLKGETDTLFGKLKERNTHLMEHTNAWMMHPNGNIQKYKRKELSAVGMGNDLFIVKEKIKGYGTQLLKVGARGTITLYELHNSSGATYFLMKEGQAKGPYVITDMPKGRGYKDQKKMKKYFADDSELYEKIDAKKYTPALTPAAVREYNERHPDSSNGLH